MNEEKIIAYAEKATNKIKDRIREFNENEAKAVLMYVVARWAELNTPELNLPIDAIDAETKCVNDLLDEAIENCSSWMNDVFI